MLNFLRPIVLFVIGNIVGILYTYNTNNGTHTYEMPEIIYTKEMMLDTFIMIFFNNAFVLIVSFFLIRFILFIKNLLLKENAVYSKADSFLYHIINGTILFRTGISAGFIVSTLSIETNTSFFALYLKGIIPHGVIEMIPFMIAFHINYLLIKNKEWDKPFHFQKRTLYILLLLIFLAAVVESVVTPFILF